MGLSVQVNTVGPLLVAQALVRHGLIGSCGDSIIGNVTSKVSFTHEKLSIHIQEILCLQCYSAT